MPWAKRDSPETAMMAGVKPMKIQIDLDANPQKFPKCKRVSN
jgi:hypothetical protein